MVMVVVVSEYSSRIIMEDLSGIWRIGILLEASYLPQLKHSPMRLIKPLSSGLVADRFNSGALVICKQGLLNTYQYANEYITHTALGCVLHAVNKSSYRYPSMLAVPVVDDNVDLDDVLKHHKISLQSLHVVTGLPQTSEPTILLASQHFMQSYGFFTREHVRFRWYCPVPLQQVMLTPVPPFNYTPENVECIIRQLYDKSESECIIVHQEFNYIFRANIDGGDVVLTFRAVDCSPLLQGKLTKATLITVLTSTTASACNKRRRSTCEDGRMHADSAASALEVDETDENRASQGFMVEAVTTPAFKLQSHYVILPKEAAVKHGIFHCQNVLVESANVQTDPSSLSEVTLPLSVVGAETDKRVHVATAFLYEDEFELEQYIPPMTIGADYDTAALTVAYLHPELLFFLFPETLSPSKHYYLDIKRAKRSIEKVKVLQVAQVQSPEMQALGAQPEESLEHNDSVVIHSVVDHFMARSVLLNVGDVFKVISGSGQRRYYKVCSLGSGDCDAGDLDADIHTSWQCILQPKKVHSYIPDVVPPSPLLPISHLLHAISPPGLTVYTDLLFSFFLPAFRARSSTQPHRCPSVLIHGPPGVGKRTIVQAVAHRCRIHVVELNCHEFTSDIVPFAEKKFVTDLDHATSFDPVVVILSNVHMLGRKNATHEEPRISAFFELYMTEINTFNRSSHFPVIIVGVTSKLTQVPSRVQSCFLQQLKVLPPNQDQRLTMVKSLAQVYHLSPEVNLPKLSQDTAGYVLGDLASLFVQAYESAVTSTIQYCIAEGNYDADDIAIGGVVIKQTHLDDVLKLSHSRHSDSMGTPKIPNVKWEDVGGLTLAKQELLDTIQLPLHYPNLFGSNARSGVLLYGAPGTGKTLLAKAVATEFSLNFISVKGPELINKYVGQSEENIREVFGSARKCAPCVVFFDELDSIAPSRGHSGDSGGVMDRVVSQLLAELDGLHKAKDVFIIGATNRPDLIDPALLRPGRFDRLVYLEVDQGEGSKEKILKAITRKFQLSQNVNLKEIAKRCPTTLTGADLYALCSDAMMTAMRRHINLLDGTGGSELLQVQEEDFLTALEGLTPSVTAKELLKYKQMDTELSTS